VSSTPELSVVMSVYNGEDYIEETLDSIINQTYTNWELVVVNDCSKDSTAQILERYASKDERIKVHTNEVNLKLPTSLNKAVSLAQGKYILRMDADDICLPQRFEKQYAYMEENPDTDLSSTRFLTVKNGTYAPGGCGGRCDDKALKAMLLVANPILHPGVIAKAQVMKELLYDVTLTCTEDLELWSRMALKGCKLGILREYLMVYRLHDKQITSTTLERQHKEVLAIEEKYYSGMLSGIDDRLKDFYISGIYFKENADAKKFCKFFSFLKKANKEKKTFSKDVLNYAMLEILAEYKRQGISKPDIIKAMLRFNPLLLIKEMKRRKKDAKEDVAKCKNVAVSLGLKQIGGTDEFPIFARR